MAETTHDIARGLMDDGEHPYVPGVNCGDCGRFVARDGWIEIAHREMSNEVASVEGQCSRCGDAERVVHDPGLVARIAGLVPGEIDLGNYVVEWPADEIEFQRHGDWTSFDDRWAKLQVLRKAKLAAAVLDLLADEGRLCAPAMVSTATAAGTVADMIRAHDEALVAQLRAEAAKSRAAGFEGVAEGLEEAVRLIGEVAW